jgi:hypothetical protein
MPDRTVDTHATMHLWWQEVNATSEVSFIELPVVRASHRRPLKVGDIRTWNITVMVSFETANHGCSARFHRRP